MHDKSNDERLKILQDRLSKIKEKKEAPILKEHEELETQKTGVHNSPQSKEITESKWELEENKKSPIIKYLVILFIFTIIGFYSYNNIDSLFSNTEIASEKAEEEEETLFTIKYNLDIEGKLAIINSFQDENLAKEMVKNLTTKGFKCDYFFLPNKSNSTEKVYKVFIGPYESLEEVNQWKQNVNGEVEILNL